MFIEHFAVPVQDFDDGGGFIEFPHVGDARIGTGHFQRGDPVGQAPYGHGRIVVILHQGGDAQPLGQLDGLFRTVLHGHLDGGHIVGIGEGRPVADGAVEAPVIVLGIPFAGDRRILYGVPGGGSLFQGVQIHKGFHGGTGLPFRHDGTVELVGAPAPDHGLDVAGLGINGHNGALGLFQLVAVGVVGGSEGGGFFRSLLHIRIQGGVDFQALLVHGVGTELVHQQLDAVIDEVLLGAGRFIEALVGQGLRIGLVGFFLGDEPVFGHLLQHCLLPGLGGLGVGQGGVVVGALGDPGDHGTLGQIQIFHVFAEVGVGGGFYPVSPLAEVDLVHVHLQDLVLGVFLFDLEGNEGFMELPAQGLFLGQEVVLGQLLGDGAAPLDLAPPDIGVDGPADPPEVDASVFIEPDVFCRQERMLEVLGDFVDGHRDPVFFRIHRGDQVALGVEELGGSHGSHVLGEDLGGGELGHRKEGGHRKEAHQHQSHQGRKNRPPQLLSFVRRRGTEEVPPVLVFVACHHVSSYNR